MRQPQANVGAKHLTELLVLKLLVIKSRLAAPAPALEKIDFSVLFQRVFNRSNIEWGFERPVAKEKFYFRKWLTGFT